jgi:hypothetical protein
LAITANVLKVRVQSDDDRILEKQIQKAGKYLERFAQTVAKDVDSFVKSDSFQQKVEDVRTKLSDIGLNIFPKQVPQQEQQQQVQDKEVPEYTLEVDVQKGNVKLQDQNKPNISEQPVQLPQPVVSPQPVQQPIVPAKPQPVQPQQPYFLPPVYPQPFFPPFGQAPAFAPQMYPQAQPQQVPAPKNLEQSWTFQEVVQNKPLSSSMPQPTPVPAQQNPLSQSFTEQAPAQQKPVASRFEKELKTIQEMGLTDNPAKIAQLLEKHNGNMAAVVNDLLAQ